MAFNQRYSEEQINQAARPGEAREKVIERLRKQGEKGQGTAIVRAPVQDALPFWPDAVRAIPNDVARSSLFTVRSFKTPRKAFRDAEIFALGKVRLTFSGVELRAADDELVWQQLLHYARKFGTENWIEFTPTQLCRDLGWPVNSTYRAKLRQSMLSLRSATVLVENLERGKAISVDFVRDFEYETKDGEKIPRWRVRLGQQMSAWFAGHQFTQIELNGYRELDPVARRLCDYVCSHQAPYALKLATLQDMCGSDTKETRKWLQQVKKALIALQEKGFISHFQIDNDLVSMFRSEAAS